MTINYTGTGTFLKPEKDPEIVLQYEDDWTDDGLLCEMLYQNADYSRPIDFNGADVGRRGVSRDTFSHFEKGHFRNYLQVQANVGDPGAGNSSTFTLANTYSDSGDESYPIVNDTYLLTYGTTGINKGIEVLVTAVNTAVSGAHTVTIRPVRATDNIGALTAGDRLLHLGTSFPKMSTPPDGRVSLPIEKTYKLQIFRRSIKLDPSNMADVGWVEYTDKRDIDMYGDALAKANGKGYSWTHMDLEQTVIEHKIDLELDTVFGAAQDTNTNVNAVGQSLHEFMLTEGNSLPYTIGNFNLTQFKQLINLQDSNQLDPEYWMLVGTPLYQQFQDFISQTWQNGAIQYASFLNSSEVAMKLHFNSFQYMGSTWHMKRYRPLTHDRFGANAPYYKNLGMFLPMGGYCKTTQGDRRCLEIRYKQGPGINRMFMNTWTGWLPGVVATNATDAAEYHVLSECGLHPKKGNAFMTLIPQ